jgi:hypothetical protein
VLEVQARAFNNGYWQILRVGTDTRRRYTSASGGATWGNAWERIENPTVGSVAQSSGIPTGSVIERGSNSNGEYVRFADGTQICWIRGMAGLAVDAAVGSVFRSDVINWTFPSSFSASTTTSGAVTVANTAYWANGNFTSSTACSIRLFAPTATAAANINAIAIGRWYN